MILFGRKPDPLALWGLIATVILGFASIVIAVILYIRAKRETASRTQIRAIEMQVAAIARKLGISHVYVDGLPNAPSSVRDPFAEGLAAMAVADWHVAIANFKTALKSAHGTQLVALYSFIAACELELVRPDEALNAAENARKLAVDFAEKQGEADALLKIGAAWNTKGDHNKALEYYAQALVVSRECGDRHAEAISLANIGLIHQDRGESAAALKDADTALSILVELGEKRAQAAVYNTIGLAWSSRGDWVKALASFRKGIELTEAEEDAKHLATLLANSSLVLQSMNKFSDALAGYEQSLAISHRIGDKRGEAYTLCVIGTIYIHIGDPDKALTYENQALGLLRELGDKYGEARAIGDIGIILREKLDYRGALHCFEQSLAARQAMGDRGGVTTELLNIGQTYTIMSMAAKEAVSVPESAKARRFLSFLSTLGISAGSETPRDLAAKALPGLIQSMIMVADLGLHEGPSSRFACLKACFDTLGHVAFVSKCVASGMQWPVAHSLADNLASARWKVTDASQLDAWDQTVTASAGGTPGSLSDYPRAELT